MSDAESERTFEERRHVGDPNCVVLIQRFPASARLGEPFHLGGILLPFKTQGAAQAFLNGLQDSDLDLNKVSTLDTIQQTAMRLFAQRVPLYMAIGTGVTQAQIDVSTMPLITAHIGAVGMEIVPVSPPTQRLIPGGTFWVWQARLRPDMMGRHALVDMYFTLARDPSALPLNLVSMPELPDGTWPPAHPFNSPDRVIFGSFRIRIDLAPASRFHDLRSADSQASIGDRAYEYLQQFSRALSDVVEVLNNLSAAWGMLAGGAMMAGVGWIRERAVQRKRAKMGST